MAVPRPLANSVLKYRWICASCQRGRLQLDLRDQCRQTSSSAHARASNLNLRSRESRETGAGLLLQRTRRRRSFHSSRPRALHDPADQRTYNHSSQAVPLGDFYTDLLESPLPHASSASTGGGADTTDTTDTSLPVWVPQGDKTKEERARQVFGALKGSGYERRLPETPESQWRTLHGVPIPPRPLEPDNCCMSGCVHCVWDDYRDDLEAWASRVREAQAKAHTRTVADQPKIHLARPEVHEASSSMDDDGGGSEALWDTPSPSTSTSASTSTSTSLDLDLDPDSDQDLDQDLIYQGIPVGIRAFMATEKKIRDRKRLRREKGLKVDDY